MAKTTKPKRKPSPTHRPWDMSPEQLEALVEDLDQPGIARRKAKPLTPKMKKTWARTQTRLGRPKIGKGATTVALSIEKGLLSKADELAKQLKISRAALVSRGLRQLLEQQS